MGIRPAELAAQIRQTKAFIDADKTTVQVFRKSRSRTDTGGFTEGPPIPVGYVDIRIIPRENVPGAEELATTDGRRTESGFTIVAMPTANLARYDEFDWQGEVWELWNIRYMPEYTLKADMRSHGIPTRT